jgi:DNA-binding transcriptional LysR family regulator
MDRFQAMTTFTRVVEQGSFAKAAERLSISISAVSRQIADLEQQLNVRLLNRTTRRLSLTETGQAYYERCVQLLADLEEAEALASASSAAPRGTIKLACSINFGVRHVAPAIADFLARFPQAKFDVALSDRTVDLIEEGYDLAIRIGNLGPSNLVARKLGSSRMLAVASPDYLARHGTPGAPEDLVRHNCLTYEYLPNRGQWSFRDAQGAERSVRVAGGLHANNGDLLVGAAAAGLGIAFEPDFMVGEALRAGRLVRVLEAYEAPEVGIHAVYPSRRHLSAKVRSFVDFVGERFAAVDAW